MLGKAAAQQAAHHLRQALVRTPKDTRLPAAAIDKLLLIVPAVHSKHIQPVLTMTVTTHPRHLRRLELALLCTMITAGLALK
jgi:hypothetical protein